MEKFENLEKKEKITCLSCNEEVEVKMIDYGGGKIATCPSCEKLAYNSEK